MANSEVPPAQATAGAPIQAPGAARRGIGDGFARAGASGGGSGQPSGGLFPGTEDIDPSRVFAGPGYWSPPAPRNPLATTTLWLTVLFIFLPPLLVLSAGMGGVALFQSVSRGGVGRRQSLAAIIISAVCLLLWILIYLVLRHL
ncbi:hypothetical protein I6B53_00900 [Schaalia sp. 19OD2882]|uniref:hypothetical protein n=1 Tax=Schaalia sp. 19OD2882 TaxID=2794089 RepID=UPI001C1ED216|nr:hypothetical protein [Schaalia sp. 19OD2882]QWW19730.1 hypothetical protein I6B53_00900 [Schaalia sp. 19OD2882]